VANRHFGKLADVWKHVVLGELLASEQPLRYGETHAGSAAYLMVEDDERRFGVLNFLRVADADPALADTRYAIQLRDLIAPADGAPTYPGSPVLAMLERRSMAEYILCDLDGTSIDDLECWSDRLGLSENVKVVMGDGMITIAARFIDRDSPLKSLAPAHRPGAGRAGNGAVAPHGAPRRAGAPQQ
jgi:23S rRNA A2030 N6-methylase RlmJ